MIRRPPRSTRVRSSAASDVYKRQLRDRGGRLRLLDVGEDGYSGVTANGCRGPRHAEDGYDGEKGTRNRLAGHAEASAGGRAVKPRTRRTSSGQMTDRRRTLRNGVSI